MKEVIQRNYNCNCRLLIMKNIEHLNSPFYLDIHDTYTEKQHILFKLFERAFNYMETRSPTESWGLYFTYTSILVKTSVGLNIELC